MDEENNIKKKLHSENGRNTQYADKCVSCEIRTYMLCMKLNQESSSKLTIDGNFSDNDSQ